MQVIKFIIILAIGKMTEPGQKCAEERAARKEDNVIPSYLSITDA